MHGVARGRVPWERVRKAKFRPAVWAEDPLGAVISLQIASRMLQADTGHDSSVRGTWMLRSSHPFVTRLNVGTEVWMPTDVPLPPSRASEVFAVQRRVVAHMMCARSSESRLHEGKKQGKTGSVLPSSPIPS